ncbi:MAG: BMP family ABC transporter substrate-binding protein [Treponema sp.]|jgi:simple sugar transport system substrate-binding protein|nr:BMP family ABC transporter substrate-binding protein [Treponema sp.]
MKFKTLLSLAVALLLSPSLFASGARSATQTPTPASLSVLVYITGVVAGSPPYELLVQGAHDFAAAHDGVTIKVYEAQFNQATWEEQLTSLVASGEYDLVLGSNPSLPEICENVARKFPKQKFVITDAELAGNPQISTYLYNQYEQSLYLGYLAGLVTTSVMPNVNESKRIGFIAAQEYPILTRQIVPGFLDGARMVDPDITLDTRIIGNWYDANKAAELASSMIDAGVDVFASIAGGATAGLINTARERGAYVVFYNTNEYASAPGVIVGCGLMRQRQLVEEILAEALAGTLQYGKAKTVGLKEGYLDFFADDPLYIEALPESVRSSFAMFMEDLRAGRIAYTAPSLY